MAREAKTPKKGRRGGAVAGKAEEEPDTVRKRQKKETETPPHEPERLSIDQILKRLQYASPNDLPAMDSLAWSRSHATPTWR